MKNVAPNGHPPIAPDSFVQSNRSMLENSNRQLLIRSDCARCCAVPQ